MTAIEGLVGLRPAADRAPTVTAPPYDVIKKGSKLEALLDSNPDSLFHVTLGADPVAALAKLQESGALIEDDEAAYYVTEQVWGDQRRLGFFGAVAVSDYPDGQVIRHEKTFDEKVQGRIALAQKTGVTMEPIFLLTKSDLDGVLEIALAQSEALYAFESDFNGLNDLHGIANKIVRVPVESDLGRQLTELVAANPLYIADGHHRYHTALKSGMTHCFTYITSGAEIQAYNRVIKGANAFADIKAKLDLKPSEGFITPAKHQFCIYDGADSYLLDAQEVPTDVVGKLDCSILERELYPHLGVNHSHIIDQNHFDYYPESQLDQMQEQVDSGKYDIAVALAPVSIDELMAVADQGLADGAQTVMPEKSTFFAPKVLSGLFIYRHRLG